MPIKFYIRNSYERSEINELLDDQGVPCELREALSEEIYNHFYELGFEVEYNQSGKITKVTPVEKKR